MGKQQKNQSSTRIICMTIIVFILFLSIIYSIYIALSSNENRTIALEEKELLVEEEKTITEQNICGVVKEIDYENQIIKIYNYSANMDELFLYDENT